MTEPTARRVPLTHEPATIVDAEDHDRVVAAGPWQYGLCGSHVYAQRAVSQPDGSKKVERLHTFLTGWPLVDHIDGNGLNNRRSNLRPATVSQNNANSRARLSISGYRGVARHKPTGLWQAYIHADGKHRSCGYFRDVVEAARARDLAAFKHFGEFARLNFPEEAPW